MYIAVLTGHLVAYTVAVQQIVCRVPCPYWLYLIVPLINKLTHNRERELIDK